MQLTNKSQVQSPLPRIASILWLSSLLLAPVWALNPTIAIPMTAIDMNKTFLLLILRHSFLQKVL